MSVQKKQFHLLQLVAVCVKKDISPKKVGFADFILNATAAYWGFEKRTAKKYVDILIRSFKHDKWRNHVETNQFLNKEEKEAWIQKHL